MLGKVEKKIWLLNMSRKILPSSLSIYQLRSLFLTEQWREFWDRDFFVPDLLF